MIEWVVLPKMNYPESLDLMNQKVEDVILNNRKTYVLLLEYDDVYTLGSSASIKDLLNISQIPFYHTDRGGKTTYHGPGQRIIYPVVHLSYFNKDLKAYMNFLTKILIDTFAEFGLKIYFCPEKIGIWTKYNEQEYKIASIGIRIKKWVAYHGIAINIATNLNKFDGIIACGLDGYKQISLQSLGLDVSFAQFDKILQKNFNTNFGILNTVSTLKQDN